MMIFPWIQSLSSKLVTVFKIQKSFVIGRDFKLWMAFSNGVSISSQTSKASGCSSIWIQARILPMAFKKVWTITDIIKITAIIPFYVSPRQGRWGVWESFFGVYSATSIFGFAQNNTGRRHTVEIESFQIRETNQKKFWSYVNKFLIDSSV